MRTGRKAHWVIAESSRGRKRHLFLSFGQIVLVREEKKFQGESRALLRLQSLRHSPALYKPLRRKLCSPSSRAAKECPAGGHDTPRIEAQVEVEAGDGQLRFDRCSKG